MAVYGKDTMEGLAGNPLGDLFNLFRIIATEASSDYLAPQILIECDAASSYQIVNEVQKTVNAFIEKENIQIMRSRKKKKWQQYCPLDLRFEIDDSGVYIRSRSYVSTEREDCENDPLIDPLAAAVDAVKACHPSVKVNICLQYHFNYGYTYGTDYLWVEGDPKPLIAKMIDAYLRDDRFCSWCNCVKNGYRSVLNRALELSDLLSKDWIDISWSRVPGQDAELRSSLLEQIDLWKKEHPEASL